MKKLFFSTLILAAIFSCKKNETAEHLAQENSTVEKIDSTTTKQTTETLVADKPAKEGAAAMGGGMPMGGMPGMM